MDERESNVSSLAFFVQTCYYITISFTLSRIEIERAASVNDFVAQKVPSIKDQQLGMAIVSIHADTLQPEGMEEDAVGFSVPVKNIDAISKRGYTVTARATTDSVRRCVEAYPATPETDREPHIDAGFPEPVSHIRASHHYTPYGSGLVRAARVQSSAEDWEALTLKKDGSHDATITSIAEDLREQFEEIATDWVEIKQGDVVSWLGFAQSYDGDLYYPLMHEFVTTGEDRLLIVS